MSPEVEVSTPESTKYETREMAQDEVLLLHNQHSLREFDDNALVHLTYFTKPTCRKTLAFRAGAIRPDDELRKFLKL